MFGLSFGELAIIAILALLLLGPDRLPDAAKTFAKGLKDLRRATDDLKDQIGSELSVVDDVKKSVTDAVLRAPAAPPPQRGPPPVASADNVPGLEAAMVEPAPPPGGGSPGGAKGEG